MTRQICQSLAFTAALAVAQVVATAPAQALSPPAAVASWSNFNYGTFRPQSVAGLPDGQRLVTLDAVTGRLLLFEAATGHFLYRWHHVDPADPAADFRLPSWVTVAAPAGEILLADAGRHRISVFDQEGAFVREWGGWGREAGRFLGPNRVATDGVGQVYVADWAAGSVSVFALDGSFRRRFGSPGDGPGELGSRFAVAASTDGHFVYVADWDRYRILRFDDQGQLAGSFGEAGSSRGQLGGPCELAVLAASGDLLVADTANHRLQILAAGGTWSPPLGGTGTGPGLFQQPQGVSSLADGRLLVADAGNSRVQVLDAGGGMLAAITNRAYNDDELKVPSGIAVDAERDRVYVVDQGKGKIKAFDRQGRYVLTFSADSTSLSTPTGAAVATDGSVLVAEEAAGRVLRFGLDGRLSQVLGGPGSGPGQFLAPTDVAVDPDNGDIYVVERANCRVQRFDRDGALILAWGSRGAADGQLRDPYGIAVLPQTGEVVVADTAANRLQVFDQEGRHRRTFAQHGGGVADLAWPRDLTVDRHGDLWVADTDHNRLAHYDPSGAFLGQIASDPARGIVFHPRAVDADPATGEIFVTASYESRIHVFGSDGAYRRSWGYLAENAPGELRSPVATATDPVTGQVWILDRYPERVSRFDPNGSLTFSFGRSGQHWEEDGMGWPDSLAVDPDGNLLIGCGMHEDPDDLTTPRRYVKVFDRQGRYRFRFGGYSANDLIQGIAVDPASREVFITVKNRSTVQRFDQAGRPLGEWGGSAGGHLLQPWGIAVGPAGEVFVADATGNDIQVFTPAGDFLRSFGGTGSGPGQLRGPRNLTFGPDGLLYAADSGNNRVLALYPADGSQAFAVTDRVTNPQAMTFDAAGDLYVLSAWGSYPVTRFSWQPPPASCALDADCDGLRDSDETGSDPYSADTDGDGLDDASEIRVHDTDPARADTDDDGYDDRQEIEAGTDPRDPLSPPPPHRDPVPEALVNGQAGPLLTAPGGRIAFQIRLDPGSHAGEPADWWLILRTPAGWASLSIPGGWRPGIRRLGAFPLAAIPEPLEVLALPAAAQPGTYALFFALDGNTDRRLDATWSALAQAAKP
ncbi:MAG: 6-bladed beta-propeller [Thermodesulfobacteriota bacterium]